MGLLSLDNHVSSFLDTNPFSVRNVDQPASGHCISYLRTSVSTHNGEKCHKCKGCRKAFCCLSSSRVLSGVILEKFNMYVNKVWGSSLSFFICGRQTLRCPRDPYFLSFKSSGNSLPVVWVGLLTYF